MIHSAFYQSTDDAFVEGHIVSIAPRVSGPVEKMLITDNQYVQKGQLLIEIDPKDYQVKLDESKAKLSQARAGLKMAEDEIKKAQSDLQETCHNVISTDSKLDFAKKVIGPNKNNIDFSKFDIILNAINNGIKN